MTVNSLFVQSRSALHADSLEVVAFGVVVAIDLDQVDSALDHRDIDQRKITRGRNAACRNHLTELLRRDCLSRSRTKEQSHYPVDRAWCSTTLRVAQHDRPRFVRRLARDPSRQNFANPAESHVAKRIMPIVDRHDLTIFGSRAFGDYDYRVARALIETPT